jgi:hypothetical protein
MSSGTLAPSRTRKATSSALLCSFALGHVLALPVLAQQVGAREPVAYAVEVPSGDTLLLTVTGTVEVAEKTLFGEIAAVQLVADIGSFRIAADEKGAELRSFLGRRVTLTGERTIDEDGKTVLAVREFAPGKA